MQAPRHFQEAPIPADLQSFLDDQERQVLLKALKETDFNRTAAAAKLGLNLRQMRYRIQRLGIEAPTPMTTRSEPVTHASNGAGTRWAGCASARHCPSPNWGPRPLGARIDLIVVHSISLPPGVFGGPEIEQLFTNRLDWDAHPYFAPIRGMEVSSHFLIRRDGELVQFVDCRRTRLARRRIRVVRPLQLQRRLHRYRARRPRRGAF